MELLEFFIMGIIFTVGVFAMAYLSIKVTLPWYAWVGMIGGGLLFLFGIGWAGSSFVEDIPQSGALGLAVFCMPGLLLMAFIWRKFVPKSFSF
ncbi:hypothetical protein [Ferrimonas balearica]|uniref:hypothetical protein n=1 Tax=Ferrimonas balearica TaxID=44012 RepID=UPI001C57FEA8|nr:hypothetical protein [Ferrimonas balearica]MBW3141504.1 hypothetical protein [Ferrimonas balearica]MBY6019738.1 hypothetical protein [Halomonas denitrificans]MBY6096804.1 hypothetical protein [Ferrimonas balearica]MBY6108631.1 hypothetical protein [Ferrimonas balearica]